MGLYSSIKLPALASVYDFLPALFFALKGGIGREYSGINLSKWLVISDRVGQGTLHPSISKPHTSPSRTQRS